ncbi:ABC transporter permease [Inquilinus limosus]|uniref:ABC transporter permease n=1 Tax=Inquilinus limosus TaxID=171674 RepID=UPI003F1920C0
MTTIDTPRRRSRGFARGALGRSWSGVAVLLLFYVALLVAFSLLSPWFLSFNNMMSIGSNVAFIGLMAATGTPLIIAGGLDLSVAAVAGLTGVVLALLHGLGLDIWVAAVAAILFGAAIGLINGIFTTGLRLNPLIVTLATMSIITGSALVMTGGLTRPLMVPGFNWIGSGRLFGIPVPLILMLLCYGALWVVLAKTRFGRFVYASGGNPEASRLVGVPVARTQITLYVLSGVSGAVAGLVLAAMLGAAAPDAAGKHLLTVIAAIILGGTSLFGGRGSVWGTLLAVLILGTLNNGLTLLNVSSFWQDVTRGIVLLLAVSLDQIRSRAAGD